MLEFKSHSIISILAHLLICHIQTQIIWYHLLAALTMKNTAIVSRHGMIQVHSDRSPLIKPPRFPYAYFVNHLNSFLLVETMTEIIKSLHSNVIYV